MGSRQPPVVGTSCRGTIRECAARLARSSATYVRARGAFHRRSTTEMSPLCRQIRVRTRTSVNMPRPEKSARARECQLARLNDTGLDVNALAALMRPSRCLRRSRPAEEPALRCSSTIPLYSHSPASLGARHRRTRASCGAHLRDDPACAPFARSLRCHAPRALCCSEAQHGAAVQGATSSGDPGRSPLRHTASGRRGPPPLRPRR